MKGIRFFASVLLAAAVLGAAGTASSFAKSQSAGSPILTSRTGTPSARRRLRQRA
jgi:hypothetical protein